MASDQWPVISKNAAPCHCPLPSDHSAADHRPLTTGHSAAAAAAPVHCPLTTDHCLLRIEKPEDIRLLDPAAGSGHMLTYAVDLLYLIYEEEGYAPSEIPQKILRHNLYGLEICPRAAQLAELALVLKAREKSRRFFQPENLVRPQIIELRDVRFAENELPVQWLVASDQWPAGNVPAMVDILHDLNLFTAAKNFGSLLQPKLSERQLGFLKQRVTGHWPLTPDHLLAHAVRERLLRVLEQAEALTQRYHIVVANPPYMGSGGMTLRVKDFAKNGFPDSKSDLFAMFMERATSLTSKSGYIAMVTMQSWMFLSSYEALRAKLLKNACFVTFLQIGYNSFPEMNSKIAQACAFVAKNQFQKKAGVYFNLNVAPQSADKELVFLEQLQSDAGIFGYASDFQKIPGSPIAYWISKEMLSLYAGSLLGDYATPKQGLATGDNAQFLRYWHEVSLHKFERESSSIDESIKSRRKWFPTTKGGSFRRWSGNQDYVVNWENDGEEIRRFGLETGRARSRAQNTAFYFATGATWSTISSGPISFRRKRPPGDRLGV